MSDECGKYAGALIPRWGMYFACVLDKGHLGPCQRGGTCVVHGAYVGNDGCPHWPKCLDEIIARDVAKHKIDAQECEVFTNCDGC